MDLTDITGLAIVGCGLVITVAVGLWENHKFNKVLRRTDVLTKEADKLENKK